MDVPLSIATAVLLTYQSDSICSPGAKRSTQGPKFANDALPSRMFVALTVMALDTLAGEIVQASVAMLLFAVPFPASTQTVMPSAMAALIAASKLIDGESV